MRILVLSDSPGVMRYMEQAAERERPDLILHLGDYERDAERLASRYPEYPVRSVPGNCDHPWPNRPLALLQELEGFRVLMTHGHAYGVKRGLLSMELAAREAGADAAVFGRTHTAYCENSNGIWLMNPGACGGGRSSYGVILIENGSLRCYTAGIDQ